ncbi:histidine phosphatase family protein [Cryptosporangium aurantiacum]|uniref:Broad specificity phosphatase PhoE n=1 Tax=Cryptosporangium aurantiacum TaxID=134849 RepID=A0A1M7QBS6_9ACTN|nr:histidine phosphatase family protein [Cryptosporangium aurantiacum]SHN28184.1 Broad specificity phosphatase PhoE [Cryptosporangium aurantiacum]
MAVVHLIRHGQASFGAAEYDELSDLGREQSRTVGLALAENQIRIDRAVSGALRRQRDTAELCLKAAGLPGDFTIDDRFDEYDHLGLAQQVQAGPVPTSSREFQTVLDAALEQWISGALAPPGTPPWEEFGARVWAGLEDVLAGLGKGGSGAVFTSGGVITAICARLLGLAPAGCVALHRVVINGGITKVVSGRGGIALISFNDHAHLPAAQVTYR